MSAEAVSDRNVVIIYIYFQRNFNRMSASLYSYRIPTNYLIQFYWLLL